VENGAHISNSLCRLLQSTVNKRDRNINQDRIFFQISTIPDEITVGDRKSAPGPPLFSATEILIVIEVHFHCDHDEFRARRRLQFKFPSIPRQNGGVSLFPAL
jgi:hypothetical protein